MHEKMGHPAKIPDMPFLYRSLALNFAQILIVLSYLCGKALRRSGRRYSETREILNSRTGATKYSVYDVRLRSRIIVRARIYARTPLQASGCLSPRRWFSSLLQISQAKLLVALFFFVNAHSLQIPAFPSRAPCKPRIMSLYTATCQVAAVLARGSGVRLSNHACRLFEKLVTSRSNAKSAFVCVRRHFLQSCKICLSISCPIFSCTVTYKYI